MVNEKNIYLIENKKAQILEIREIENQVESQSNLVKIANFIGISKVECGKNDSERDLRERERDRVRYRDLDARTVDRSKETAKEAGQHNTSEFNKMKREVAEDAGETCEIL